MTNENTHATTTYTSLDQLPITLKADELAAVLGISRAGAYTLMRSKGFPTIFIGKRMVVYRDKFIQWMDEQVSVS
jgi:predicted DNA-binding transcriptional regulator AlpA